MGVRHVFDSRSLAFAEGVRAATGGEGVHVVLNSLAGDFIAASLGVVARGGCFLELGKRDILTPEEAARLRPDVRYHAFDLGAEALADHGLLRPMLDELCAALAAGELRPLPVATFPLAQVSEAFRFMAQARHVGKLVLRAARCRGRALPGRRHLLGHRWPGRAGARDGALAGALRRPPPGPERAQRALAGGADRPGRSWSGKA